MANTMINMKMIFAHKYSCKCNLTHKTLVMEEIINANQAKVI